MLISFAPGVAGGPPGDDPNPNLQPPQDAGDSDEDFADEEEFEDIPSRDRTSKSQEEVCRVTR